MPSSSCGSEPLQLYWLPKDERWNERVREIVNISDDDVAWQRLVELANCQIGLAGTMQLNSVLHRRFPAGTGTVPEHRLAVLGFSTLQHLIPGLLVAALRRGIRLVIYLGAFGQYHQELMNRSSGLHAFRPATVLFCLDEEHLFGTQGLIESASLAEEQVTAAMEEILHVWQMASKTFGCGIIQQTILSKAAPIFGNNEHRFPGSSLRLAWMLNERIRMEAEAHNADVLALDQRICTDSLFAWHDPMLWYRARMEISPSAAHFYGELVLRILAARAGRSAKCLVLDLDNTLWGGVIGDEGLGGIKLGQGDATGEAYLAFQRYVRNLSRRGIILAVCSKNDESNALQPFRSHPEMILREEDIACFSINWNDKASNIRDIATRLNLSLDHLVFVDDNPFERNLVRGALPMVAVPELPNNPAFFERCISDAGYFEGAQLTSDDLERNRQYQGNLRREALKGSVANLDDYLASLEMELAWSPFDEIGIQRITQLINKTNQFNLTTRRYSEREVQDIMCDPRTMALQLRLGDRFGDNGMIAVIIAHESEGSSAVIDTWLMSCRVLGRNVEHATLNLLVQRARERGITRLRGEYIPTNKNGIVRDLYEKLGFMPPSKAGEVTHWDLNLDCFKPFKTFVRLKEA